MKNDEFPAIRPARVGDGESVFDMTRQSVADLVNNHYSPEQIGDWIGERTSSFYENLIATGRMVAAEQGGRIVGFVDAEPGEVTRLFVAQNALPTLFDAAGSE